MAAASASVSNYVHHRSGGQRDEAPAPLNSSTSARASVYATLTELHSQLESDFSTEGKSKNSQDADNRRADQVYTRIPKDAKFLIDPKGRYQSRWDIIMVILLLYTATITPYEVRASSAPLPIPFPVCDTRALPMHYVVRSYI